MMGLVLLQGALMLAAGMQPNVVLLSVDTLRADHLGCYGFPADISPAIDRFAEDALVFDDCVCEVPLTNPSFGAMLSSLYPRMTGTTRNGLRMPPSVPLITEAFQAAGYHTVCVQSNWTLKGKLSGLDRGFEVYEDDFEQKRWGLIKGERYAEDVTGVALDLLERRDGDRPFFFWIHYSDPHAPYLFRRDFNPLGKKPLWLKNRDKVHVKYASEVAYADHHIGRLLAALPRQDTAVLFVADHGESLYEHDYLGHGRRIYQTNQRVPLIIRAPGVAPGRTPAPACVFDVGPTLLGLAGLGPPPGMLGTDLLNHAAPASRARFIEAYGGAVPKVPGAKALMVPRPPIQRGLIRDGWKLIIDVGAPKLFYLPDDPLEQKDLAAEHPERVAEFTQLVEIWDSQHQRGKTEAAAMSDEDVEALRNLGYLE